MDTIMGNSVSWCFSEALWRLVAVGGIAMDSRVGKVLVFPNPVCTTYRKPLNRVLFSPLRDANPFFHMMEALWMLAGRYDLAFPLRFNKRFSEYSDDGKTIWGAYGWRWRAFFGHDQLGTIVHELKRNPDSRRCVLSMWNAMEVGEQFSETHGESIGGAGYNDLAVAMNGGKDVPCNTHAYFDMRDGRLNMTVCNRSNDMVWGCYGANAVHFSILLEYMAWRIGVPVGVYRQMSNNLHIYTDIFKENTFQELAVDLVTSDRYTGTHRDVTVPSMFEGANEYEWRRDLERFLRLNPQERGVDWRTPFFSDVAWPMLCAHTAWREKNYEEAFIWASKITAWDWRIACLEWLERRQAKAQEKNS